MEVSGVAFRSLSCFSGAGFNPHSSKRASVSALLTGAGDRIPDVDLRVLCSLDSKASMRTVKLSGFSASGFSDSGNLLYYVSPRSDAIKKKEKKDKKDSEMMTIKKKLKFIKVLSRDLSMLSSWGFGVDVEGGLIDEDKSKRISEAAGLLLEQLKLLRVEEKEMKRKRKEEKAREKATQLIETAAVSNNRSDSSERENTQTVNIQRGGAVAEAKSIMASLLMQEQKKMQKGGGIELESPIMFNYGQETCSRNRGSCSSGSNIGSSGVAMEAIAERRIEVCMGGKCKKGGGMALLEEFQKKVGTEATVVGCKCMGKCRDGPNVRVLNDKTSQKNPLCIGVGLEDVGLIVANFTGEERKDLDLMAA